jgi:hypothetical protein
MVQSGVNENSGIIPCTGLDTDGLVDERMLREVTVRDSDSCIMRSW